MSFLGSLDLNFDTWGFYHSCGSGLGPGEPSYFEHTPLIPEYRVLPPNEVVGESGGGDITEKEKVVQCFRYRQRKDRIPIAFPYGRTMGMQTWLERYGRGSCPLLRIYLLPVPGETWLKMATGQSWEDITVLIPEPVTNICPRPVVCDCPEWSEGLFWITAQSYLNKIE